VRGAPILLGTYTLLPGVLHAYKVPAADVDLRGAGVAVQPTV